jgi:hypothetical protein
MTKFVGLFTAVILGLLAFQAEPITAFLGYAWAALHLIAVVKNWYDNRA